MLKQKSFFIFFALLFLFLSNSFADDGKWEKISNPYMIGKVEEISIGRDNSQTQYIFAATSTESGKLWKSINSGQTWSSSHEISGYYHTRVCIQANNFQYGWTLMKGTSGQDYAGPYLTEDQGDNWNLKTNSLPYPENLQALAGVQNQNFTTAFVGGWGTGAAGGEKLFKYNSAYDQWDPSQNGLPTGTNGTVFDIAIDQANSDIMFCAYEDDDVSSYSGIYRSVDGGAYWEHFAFNGTASAKAVAIKQSSSPDKMYIAEYAPNRENVYYSSNPMDLTPNWGLAVWNSLGECSDIEMHAAGIMAYFAFQSADGAGDFHWLVFASC